MMKLGFLSATWLLIILANSLILGADQRTKVLVLAPEVGVTTADLRPGGGYGEARSETFKGTNVFFDRDKTGNITAIRVRDDHGLDKVYPASKVVSISFQSQCKLEVSGRWSLQGRWAAYSKYGSKRADCQINQEQDKLEFLILRNPVDRSAGRFLNDNTVVAEGWGQQKGTVSSDGKRIDWTDSYWLRVD